MRSDKHLKWLAQPYLSDLGLAGERITFARDDWASAHGTCEVFRTRTGKISRFRITVLGSTRSIKTIRRTLAHELRHVWQHLNGQPVTERDAEKYAREMMKCECL